MSHSDDHADRSATRRPFSWRNLMPIARRPSSPEMPANAHDAPLVDGRPGEDLIPLEADIHQKGYHQACRSGDIDENPQTVERLIALAEESASRLAAAPYDPAGNLADGHHEAARQRALVDLTERRQQEAYARVAVTDRRCELAAHGPAPEEPRFPILVGLLGMLGVALTLTITFHDLVFVRVLPGGAQAIVASFLSGLILAGTVTWGLLAGASHEGSERSHWGWMLIGLAFGAGLLLMRLSVARTDGERLLGYGFAIAEVVAVMVLELFASGLRREWARYRRELGPFVAAQQQVAVAEQRHAALEEGLAASEERVAALDHEVRVRESLVRANGAIRSAARAAILAGYRRGIDENRGHRAGFADRPPTKDEILARVHSDGRTNGQVGRT